MRTLAVLLLLAAPALAQPAKPAPLPPLKPRKTKHYVLLSDLTDAQQLKTLTAFVDGMHATYTDQLREKPVRAMTPPVVRVYLRQADYRQYGKQDKAVRFNQNWRGYYARPRNELVSYLGQEPLTKLCSILSHEGFHQFVWRYVVRPGSDRLPDWIEEGLADYFRAERLNKQGRLARTPKPRHLRRLRAAIQAGTAWPWKRLWKTDPANLPRQEEFDLFYAHAYVLARFLMERGGQARVKKLYRLKRQGVFTQDALLRVFPPEQRAAMHRAFLRYAWKLGLPKPKQPKGARSRGSATEPKRP